MIQEKKDLLLKDLCGRLPYGVKVQIKNEIVVLDSICNDDGYYFNFIGEDREGVNIGNIKPYLFPLSSMTEEQCYELSSIRSGFQDCWKYIKTSIPLAICNFEQIDWFHKNHFDYRGLIPMGLAIDATGLNIY
jgi:hypothetical protein